MIIREYLSQNEKIIDLLITAKVMPVNIRHDIKLYDMYACSISDGNKRFVSIQFVAEQVGVSFRTAYRVIQKMEQTV